MKKLQTLGKSLSKEEQKSIKGGYIDPGDGEIGPCPSDMSCDDTCPRQTSCKKEAHLSYCACYTT